MLYFHISLEIHKLPKFSSIEVAKTIFNQKVIKIVHFICVVLFYKHP